MPAKPYGLIATFEDPGAVYHAAEAVRDAGFKHWDVLTPFPVHGLDRAMGLKRSRVPRFTLFGGVLGFSTGMSMIWFMNAYDYPLIVAGKPLFSPMFAFPVSYELTILFAAFGTLLGMFLLNRLPMHYHPALKYEKFSRGTNDRFFIVIESRDPKFRDAETRQLLERAGGSDITQLEE